jgi:hypothetical protein
VVVGKEMHGQSMGSLSERQYNGPILGFSAVLVSRKNVFGPFSVIT